MVRSPGLALVVAATLALTGCAARSVSIRDLRADPDRYHNRSVSIAGTVTTSVGSSLLPVQFYTISDGTGEVNVLARSNRPPTRGAHVRVKGKVNQVATVNGRAIGLHLQEEGRKRTD